MKRSIQVVIPPKDEVLLIGEDIFKRVKAFLRNLKDNSEKRGACRFFLNFVPDDSKLNKKNFFKSLMRWVNSHTSTRGSNLGEGIPEGFYIEASHSEIADVVSRACTNLAQFYLTCFTPCSRKHKYPEPCNYEVLIPIKRATENSIQYWIVPAKAAPEDTVVYLRRVLKHQSNPLMRSILAPLLPSERTKQGIQKWRDVCINFENFKKQATVACKNLTERAQQEAKNIEERGHQDLKNFEERLNMERAKIEGRIEEFKNYKNIKKGRDEMLKSVRELCNEGLKNVKKLGNEFPKNVEKLGNGMLKDLNDEMVKAQNQLGLGDIIEEPSEVEISEYGLIELTDEPYIRLPCYNIPLQCLYEMANDDVGNFKYHPVVNWEEFKNGEELTIPLKRKPINPTIYWAIEFWPNWDLLHLTDAERLEFLIEFMKCKDQVCQYDIKEITDEYNLKEACLRLFKKHLATEREAVRLPTKNAKRTVYVIRKKTPSPAPSASQPASS